MGLACIVYTNGNETRYKRYLHTVNHCFICVADEGKWMVCDYTSRGLELSISPILPKGLYYQRIEINTFSILPYVPTCVGHVKRAAGIYNPLILTPWQLLKYMRRL